MTQENVSKPSSRSSVIAVGGVGGSGTRLIAAFLDRLGIYMGDDQNESLDNLWFNLLFKQHPLGVFDPEDVAFVKSLGFDVDPT